MENISEKRPRGRPRKATRAEWASTIDVHGKSYRRKANYIYEIRAIGRISDDPRFEWLCSDGPTIMAGKGHMRRTILSELGRIEDAEEREQLALYLCELQPTTREAIAILRRYRIGRPPPGTVDGLADGLRTTLNTYLRTHTELSWDDVREALAILRGDVEAAAEAAAEAAEGTVDD
jgi:hypothetical protein